MTNTNTTFTGLSTLIQGEGYPVYAFAKPGMGAQAARLFNKPSHLSHVSIDDIRTLVTGNKALFYHERVKRMVENAGPQQGRTTGTYLTYDCTMSGGMEYDHSICRAVHPQLVQYLTDYRGDMLYTSSRLVLCMADYLGVAVQAMPMDDARSAGMKVAILCKAEGRTKSMTAFNCIYSGCPVQMVLY